MNILDRNRIIGNMASHNISPKSEARSMTQTALRHGQQSAETAMDPYHNIITLGHSGLLENGVFARARSRKRKAHHYEVSPRRTLIVGACDKGQTLAKELTSNFPTDYNVVGFVDDDRVSSSGNYGPVLGGREQLADLVQNHQIDEVIVANCLTETNELARLLAHPSTETEPTPVATQLNGANLFNGDLLPLDMPQALPPAFQQGLKRAFDIVVSSLALIMLAPVLALVAIATKLTSPGPIFYRQQRVGQGGKLFTIYKVRSMKVDAESKTGPILAQRNDDRTTPLGRFLRATHLDEAPQFYNVLRGDMSIVGPRPERPCFVEAYNQHIPAYPERHLVRPGITGLAQVSAGYLSHAYVKLHYDLAYVYNHSVWRDICILAQTPVTIIKTMKSPE